MRTTNPRVALVIGALFLVAACDEPSRSPTAPTVVAPPVAPAPPPAPPPFPADPISTHTLTFTASDSCSLPPDAMRRVYEVAIEEKQQEVIVEVNGQQMVSFAATPGFTGTRDGNTVTFVITDNCCEGFGFVERIPLVGDLSFVGQAAGTISGATITAIFDGTLSIDPWFLTGVQKTACQASDHRMVFEPIGER